MMRMRWMVRSDMPDVLAIEKSLKDSWSETTLLMALRKRNVIGQVVTGDKGKVLGYVIYELGTHALEMVRLNVAEDSRRCGIGSKMVERLKDKLGGSSTRRNLLTAVVADTNLEAHLFLKANGLRATHISDTVFDGCDAYLFEYSIECEAAVMS